MPATFKLVSFLFALVAVGAASYWLGSQRGGGPPPTAAKNAPATPPPTAPATPVEVAVVTTGKLAKSIETVGSLRSDESVMLRPEVSGRIAAILFREGERVAKGAVLVRFDTSVQQAELQQAEANLALNRSKHERAVDLQKKGFISAQARDEAENTLRLAEAAHGLAVARLGKLEVKAPFAGTIGLRAVSVGDYVREGQDIANIEEIDPIKVDFRVPEIFIKDVRVGQPIEVAADAFPDRRFDGKIAAINPLLDANGRSLVIRAVVTNKEAKLRPGMFARVKLITQNVEEGMTIPEEALIPQGDDFFVFRVIDSRAQRTKIEIGERRAGAVRVTTGLTKVDQVITAGHNKIRDGGAVRVQASRAVPGTPPAPPETARAPQAKS